MTPREVYDQAHSVPSPVQSIGARIDAEVNAWEALTDRRQRCLDEHGLGCGRAECGRSAVVAGQLVGFDGLIAKSSIGAGLANIRENGIDAELAPKPKRRKGTSPTQRTLAELRKRGWPAGVVEKFVRFPPPGHHVDLFGVLDVVAIVTELDTATRYMLGSDPPRKGSGTIGIQACAGGNGDHARRRAKILAEPRARTWVEAGNRLELWSWSKRGDRGKAKLWTLRVETYEQMQAAR